MDCGLCFRLINAIKKLSKNTTGFFDLRDFDKLIIGVGLGDIPGPKNDNFPTSFAERGGIAYPGSAGAVGGLTGYRFDGFFQGCYQRSVIRGSERNSFMGQSAFGPQQGSLFDHFGKGMVYFLLEEMSWFVGYDPSIKQKQGSFGDNVEGLASGNFPNV